MEAYQSRSTQNSNSVLSPQELNHFIEELSHVSDRDTFNHTMQRFDQTFMERHKQRVTAPSGSFPYGTNDRPYSMTNQTYSDSYSHRWGQDIYNSTPSSYGAFNSMDAFSRGQIGIEGMYKVPMYDRGAPNFNMGVAQTIAVQGNPLNSNMGVTGGIDPMQRTMGDQYMRNSNFQNTGFGVSMLQQQSTPNQQVFGKNAISESMELRKLKEEMLNRSTYTPDYPGGGFQANQQSMDISSSRFGNQTRQQDIGYGRGSYGTQSLQQNSISNAYASNSYSAQPNSYSSLPNTYNQTNAFNSTAANPYPSAYRGSTISKNY